jgi:hypothetical protein
MRWRGIWLAALGAGGALLAVISTRTLMGSETRNEGPVSWEQHRLGPVESRSVFWAGHSLMESKAETPSGPIDLLNMVGRLAEAAGYRYALGDHTLWGSPLSALWRGMPHSFTRDAGAMIAKREAFEREPGRYDTLVMTEVIPLRPPFGAEFGPYYARRFYCAVKRANPKARVYIYQTWVNLHASDPNGKYGPPHRFDWRQSMAEQRKAWELFADLARLPEQRAPGGWLARIGIHPSSDAGCAISDPIFMVPVGNAFVAIRNRIQAPAPGDDFFKPNGHRLSIGDLFSNAYVDWPSDWPIAAGASDAGQTERLAGLKLRDPSRPLDDIHPSAIGIYVAAVVHFATLYRRSPVGLPHPAVVSEGLARTIQCIAWQTVVADERTGVAGSPDC